MALFRALSTRRSQRGGGYDRLLDETHGMSNDSSFSSDHAVLKRVTSVPASILFGSSSKKVGFGSDYAGKNSNTKQHHQETKAKKGGKSHPVFSLFEGKWKKKKITANPDFSRYVEYLKEGGMWNKNTNTPIIYYK